MKELFSFKLESHPGILLVEHLRKVNNIGLDIFINNNLFKEYKDFVNIILVTHDLGKSTKYFQEYIRKKRSHGSMKNHGFLSSLMAYCILSRYYVMDIAIKGLLIVKKHHGNLDNILEELSIKPVEVKRYRDILTNQLESIDFEELNYILSEFQLKELDKEEIIEAFDYLFSDMEAVFYLGENSKLDMKQYFMCKYFYSILIYSDKASLILEDVNIDRNSSEDLYGKLAEYYKGFSKSKDIINLNRQKAKEEVEKNLDKIEKRTLTLTLPTGMGKTLNSINFALLLKEKIKKEKNIDANIIYSFPFTSIIDQTYDVFKKVFGDDSKDVIKHHYLAKIAYKDEEDYYETEKSKFLIETWDSNIVVTTFVKLVETVFSNRNSELLKFIKFANSIIILDEVQNIPYKYWHLIDESFKLLSELFNTYIIMMTATQPLIIKDSQNLVNSEEYFFKLFNRTRLIIDLEEKSIDDFVAEIQSIIGNNSKVMIVLNTVKCAQEVYKAIKESSSKKVLFLSASIIPKDRRERLKQIKELDEYILVSTQVVEAGVDIDNDVVIRDIGPWDSIVQCAGRCNRNNEKGCKDVYIFKIKESGKVYANLVYGTFLINRTEKILQDKKEIFESEFYEYSKMYFDEINKDSSRDYSNEILHYIEELKFENVNNKFKLIEDNTSYIMPVFIEKDDEAVELWNKYEELYEKYDDPFERSNKFLEIKDKFLSFVININAKDYKFGITARFYNKIPRENAKDYYSEEYGFCIDDDKTMFF